MFLSCFNFIFSVHGKNMVPVKQNVVGVFRKSLKFQWIMNRGNKKTTFLVLSLFNGTEAIHSRELFVLNGKQPGIAPGGTADRLNATISGDVDKDFEIMCTVIFENLQFYDEDTSFLLEAALRPFKVSAATITLVEVKGTHFLLAFVLHVFFM